MTRRQYADPSVYEKKLDKVMERLSIKDYDFNWDRHASWVEFRYKDNLYRFEHSVEKAKSKGLNLRYGSETFAQVVLSLEDLARMVERGIYDLQTWVEGMKFLPEPTSIPSFFKIMGFDRIPSAEDVNERYRTLVKQYHPDHGGNENDLKVLLAAADQAKKYFKGETK